jgi:hypothetical protein
VTRIAAQVDAAMFAGFEESALLPLPEGMTEPKLLPFYPELLSASDPADVLADSLRITPPFTHRWRKSPSAHDVALENRIPGE